MVTGGPETLELRTHTPYVGRMSVEEIPMSVEEMRRWGFVDEDY